MSPRLRVTVTLPEDIYQALTEWAEAEDRTLANLLAHLAAKALRDRQESSGEAKDDCPSQN